MEVIIVLVVSSLLVSSGFLVAFLWATRTGQYDDTLTPPLRMLLDDAPFDPLAIKAKSAISRNPKPDSGTDLWS
ncbi:MAG: cbb3-type cytochrome oxidase assembly protein CcoS [bacterium]|nr:cbb3-type cytochrome oxidase assembly protein CcoS [bacterium]